MRQHNRGNLETSRNSIRKHVFQIFLLPFNTMRFKATAASNSNKSVSSLHAFNLNTQDRTNRQISYVSRNIVMASAPLPTEVKERLDKVADAIIDSNGKFKYILIKVFAKDGEGKHVDTNSKLVVRGRADCEYHADIYDKFQEEISKMEGVDDDVLGGGRILRKGNTISVFGYSQGYGRADHTLTVEILKKEYPSHEISWSNDGY